MEQMMKTTGEQPTLRELSDKLNEIGRYALIGAKPVLDISEASLFTGFSKGRLYRLTSERQIPHYKKNRKLYFRKTELEAWMIEKKVLTVEEIDSQASTYVVTHK
jgi:excisionase family DNA binding protein